MASPRAEDADEAEARDVGSPEAKVAPDPPVKAKLDPPFLPFLHHIHRSGSVPSGRLLSRRREFLSASDVARRVI